MVPLRPAFGIAVSIRGNDLLRERNISDNGVGAILCHTHAAFDLGLTHEWLHRAVDRGSIPNVNSYSALTCLQGNPVYIRYFEPSLRRAARWEYPERVGHVG